MAALGEDGRTPALVADTLAENLLKGIYGFLERGIRDQGARGDRRTDEIIDTIVDSTTRRSKASEANSRAVDKALKDILGNQDRSESSSKKDRATQKALFGKIEKNTNGLKDALSKFGNKIVSALGTLKNFLTPYLTKTVNAQMELQKMMRLNNLTSSQKAAVNRVASSSIDIAKRFDVNLGMDEVSQYLGELVAAGKDIELMGEEQAAAYAAMRSRGIDDAKAYTLAMSASSKDIQRMTRAIGDPAVRAGLVGAINSMEDYELAVGGIGRNIDTLTRGAQAAARTLGTTAIASGDAAKMIQQAAYQQSGQWEKVDGSIAIMTSNAEGSVESIFETFRDNAMAMDDTQRRLLGTSGDAFLNIAANASADLEMMAAKGNATRRNIRTDEQNRQASALNTKDGKMQQTVDKIYNKLDRMTGGALGRISQRLDELFGGQVNILDVIPAAIAGVVGVLKLMPFGDGVLGTVIKGALLLGGSELLKDEKFKSAMQPIIDSITKILPSDVLDILRSVGSIISDLFSIVKPLSEPIRKFAVCALDKISDAIKPVSDKMSEMSGKMSDSNASLNDMAPNLLSGIGNMIADGASSFIHGVGNAIKSVVTFLRDNMPQIKTFFHDTLVPALKDFFGMLKEIIPILWTDVVSPLLTELGPVLSDALPLILGGVLVAKLPDLITGVIPKLLSDLGGTLIKTVLPKIVGAFLAHPAIAAAVLAVAAIGIGGKWLWDRSEERRKAKVDAEAYSQASLKTLLAGDDYIKAREKYGENAPETIELRRIYENTISEKEQKRIEARSSQAVAQLNDKDAKEFIDLLNSGAVQAMNDAKDQYERVRNMKGATDAQIEQAERDYLVAQAKVYSAAYNAQSKTDTFYDTGDFDKQIAEDSIEQIKENIQKMRQSADTAGALWVAQINGLISDKDIKSLSEGMGNNTLLNAQYDVNQKAIKDILGGLNKDELYAITERLKISGVTKESTQEDLMQKIIDSGITSDKLVSDVASLMPVFDQMKKESAESKKLMDAIQIRISEKGVSIDDKAIKELAEQLGITNRDIIDNMIQQYVPVEQISTVADSATDQAIAGFAESISTTANDYNKQVNNIPKNAHGKLATSAELGIYGEDGPELILPLTKPDDMSRLIKQLSPSQKDALFNAILQEARFLKVNERNTQNSLLSLPIEALIDLKKYLHEIYDEAWANTLSDYIDHDFIPKAKDRDKNTSKVKSGTSAADLVIQFARDQLNKPYSISDDGFVCNTLVHAAYKAAGLLKGWGLGYHNVTKWFTNEPRLHKVPLSEAKPGMIGFSNPGKNGIPQHMGIITENGMWINASGSNIGPNWGAGFKASPNSKGVVEVAMNRTSKSGMMDTAGYIDGLFDPATVKYLKSKEVNLGVADGISVEGAGAKQPVYTYSEFDKWLDNQLNPYQQLYNRISTENGTGDTGTFTAADQLVHTGSNVIKFGKAWLEQKALFNRAMSIAREKYPSDTQLLRLYQDFVTSQLESKVSDTDNDTSLAAALHEIINLLKVMSRSQTRPVATRPVSRPFGT